MSSRIAVIYLARKAEGTASFQPFIKSYAAYQAGIDHELVIIFKGFQDKYELKNACREFASLHYIPIEVDDEGFDIGSYLKTAKCLTHEYICCLNTFSEIRAEGWLQKLFSHASLPTVGIVGATGSYEGVSDSMTLIQKAIWLNSQQMTDRISRASINRYFAFIFQPNSLKTSKAYKIFKVIYHYARRLAAGWKHTNELEESYTAWWNETKHKGDIANFCQFPSFPNPHIRSNAFIIKRELFLAIKHKGFVSKFDACQFECGYQGMTRQIIQAGLKALIVGKNGNAYPIEDWPNSRTFRFGHQSNLLVADNQTQFYHTASYETQLVHSLMSWGENAVHLPYDFPNLGIKFQIK